MDNNTVITINTSDDTLQTYYSTIEKCPSLTNLIKDNVIDINIRTNQMIMILNYFRNINSIQYLYSIANVARKLGIDFNENGYVYINIGGKIYYVEKKLLSNKLGYFEAFFRNYNQLDPDYSNILIDRCPNLFAKIMNFLTMSNQELSEKTRLELQYYCYNLRNYFIKLEHFKYMDYLLDHYCSRNYRLVTDMNISDNTVKTTLENSQNIYAIFFKNRIDIKTLKDNISIKINNIESDTNLLILSKELIFDNNFIWIKLESDKKLPCDIEITFPDTTIISGDSNFKEMHFKYNKINKIIRDACSHYVTAKHGNIFTVDVNIDQNKITVPVKNLITNTFNEQELDKFSDILVSNIIFVTDKFSLRGAYIELSCDTINGLVDSSENSQVIAKCSLKKSIGSNHKYRINFPFTTNYIKNVLHYSGNYEIVIHLENKYEGPLYLEYRTIAIHK
ncbi:putative BTB/POZ domain-containing protein [Acanthamoeba polyphaga mimivirus]|uniref:BTB/POZ domain-containing protein n=1 Tax=Acanthamoeba polyphaga mimivirus Kroon TaxID=3069720 RepID=A0A0G2Y3W0_9VIRU|nr:putative BTB/POZ domain-containing protein [Acanthamoeba polyphaga mimivirus]AKI80483.1 putative BTB/POZ domain-containing protein [Acanthamoeba polyphaga mimivirus Kroon]